MSSTNWGESIDDLLKPDPAKAAAEAETIRQHYANVQERALKAARDRKELPSGLKVLDVPDPDPNFAGWHILELWSQDGSLKFGSIRCTLAEPDKQKFWSNGNLPHWIQDALDTNSKIVLFDYPKSAVEADYRGLLGMLVGMAGRFAKAHHVAGIACYASTIDDRYMSVGLVELGAGTFGCDTDTALANHDAALNRIQDQDWPEGLRS